MLRCTGRRRPCVELMVIPGSSATASLSPNTERDTFPSRSSVMSTAERNSPHFKLQRAVLHGEYFIPFCLEQVNTAVAAVEHITFPVIWLGHELKIYRPLNFKAARTKRNNVIFHFLFMDRL